MEPISKQEHLSLTGDRFPICPTYLPSVGPTTHQIDSSSDLPSAESYWNARTVLCWVLRHVIYFLPRQSLWRSAAKTIEAERRLTVALLWYSCSVPWSNNYQVPNTILVSRRSKSLSLGCLSARQALDWMDDRSEGLTIGWASRNDWKSWVYILFLRCNIHWCFSHTMHA